MKTFTQFMRRGKVVHTAGYGPVFSQTFLARIRELLAQDNQAEAQRLILAEFDEQCNVVQVVEERDSA